MKVKLVAHPDQIRWYALAGLSGFDTLDLKHAAENARLGLQGILDYLDALDARDDAGFELGCEAIKLARTLELRVVELDGGDAANFQVARA